MLKYQFRLESVLKVRRMAEELCRADLGKLMVEKGNIEAEIEREKHEIAHIYEGQEKVMQEGTKAAQLTYIPMVVTGKEARIKELRRMVMTKESEIEAKKEELMKCRADLKVIEKIKEKDYAAWKVQRNRHENNIIEEQVSLWLENSKPRG